MTNVCYLPVHWEQNCNCVRLLAFAIPFPDPVLPICNRLYPAIDNIVDRDVYSLTAEHPCELFDVTKESLGTFRQMHRTL